MAFFTIVFVKAEEVDYDEQQVTNPPFLESDINIDEVINDDKHKDELQETTSSDEDATEQIVSINTDSDETNAVQNESTEPADELLTVEPVPEPTKSAEVEETETDTQEQITTESVQSDITGVSEFNRTGAVEDPMTESPEFELTSKQTLVTEAKIEESTESNENTDSSKPAETTHAIPADGTKIPIKTTELVINTEAVPEAVKDPIVAIIVQVETTEVLTG